MPLLLPGSPALDFTLPTDGGGTVSLADFRGRLVVVYFYPKDNTSGCTKQACGFRDAWPDFSGLDAVIIGISRDDPAKHDRFKANYSLPFILASDLDASVAEAYGTWVEKSMYGRSYMGMARTTFVVDRAGIVRHVWAKVKIDGHAAQVLAVLNTL